MTNIGRIASVFFESELMRFCFYGFVAFIVYHTVIKAHYEKMVNDIKNYSTQQEATKKTLLAMLYTELKRMFSSAIKQGAKSYEEDETFKSYWNNYKALGDGHGDELFVKWQNIKFMVDDETNG